MRDHHGALLAAFADPIPSTEPMEAEALAAIASMEFAMTSPWRFIVLEGDNSKVMNNLISKTSSWLWRISD
ncbi:hypothetical protein PanWU01x14_061030 [Parasponia andersonii]|uniref:RNase H type-1 domain-containing protein n=1 Tax=Parasponia andersonii TaxID=3476 RepID=A0A2P5DI68_PARAD|nr:hypothetical protein PanWU01x14_061030 [Parasponia andersonii]